MVNYSKWDGIGDSEDEADKELSEHKLNIYRSLHKPSQELFDYASAGALDLVKEVLSKGAFINSKLPQNGSTALHMAIWLQHQNVAEHLITAGADCEVKDNDGCRPIHTAAWAAFEGDPKTLTLLLEKQVELEPVSNTGNTPLHFAASSSDTCVRLLLEAGANPLIKNNDGLTARQYGEKKGFGGTMKRKQAQDMWAHMEAAEKKYLENDLNVFLLINTLDSWLKMYRHVDSIGKLFLIVTGLSAEKPLPLSQVRYE